MVFYINKYDISPVSADIGTKGSYGVETIEFVFGAEWDGLTKEVVFFPPSRDPVSVEYTSGEMNIPSEVMQTSGIVRFIVKGYTVGGDDQITKRLVTTPARLSLDVTLPSDAPRALDRLDATANEIILSFLSGSLSSLSESIADDDALLVHVDDPAQNRAVPFSALTAALKAVFDLEYSPLSVKTMKWADNAATYAADNINVFASLAGDGHERVVLELGPDIFIAAIYMQVTDSLKEVIFFDPTVGNYWYYLRLANAAYSQSKNALVPIASATTAGLVKAKEKTDETVEVAADSTGRLYVPEVGGGANVQSDWAQTDSTADDYIKNKPELSGCETTSNKVTSLSALSTDTEYPSAKCVYEAVSGATALADSASFVLTAAGWDDNTMSQTISVQGVTSDNIVIASPAPNKTSMLQYTTHNVYCAAQGDGTLTFICDSVPELNITSQAVIL